jgi:hypothetical protein
VPAEPALQRLECCNQFVGIEGIERSNSAYTIIRRRRFVGLWKLLIILLLFRHRGLWSYDVCCELGPIRA